MFKKLKKLKKPKGYWVKVEWMSGAKEYCLNLPFLMKIVWYHGDRRTGEEEIYSEARIKQLMENNIPVVFSEHPCVTIPKFVRFMHKLRW